MGKASLSQGLALGVALLQPQDLLDAKRPRPQEPFYVADDVASFEGCLYGFQGIVAGVLQV